MSARRECKKAAIELFELAEKGMFRGCCEALGNTEWANPYVFAQTYKDIALSYYKAQDPFIYPCWGPLYWMGPITPELVDTRVYALLLLGEMLEAESHA